MCQMPKEGIKMCLQHPSSLQQELCKQHCPLWAAQHRFSRIIPSVPENEEQEGRETCRDEQGAPGDIPALISVTSNFCKISEISLL